MTTRAMMLLSGCVLPLFLGCSAGGLGLDENGVADLSAARDLGHPGDGAPPDLAAHHACTGLDEYTCRATPGCVADTCNDCNCRPAFAGCVAIGEPMVQCPALGCLQPVCCRQPGECANIGFCRPPGAPLCGGACEIPPPCKQDSDCASSGAPAICAMPACACNGNQPSCQPGCTGDADCGEEEVCLGNHHCAPKPCVKDADCAPDFACKADGVGASCRRRTCQVDEDCPSSYCVEGACYLGLGVCQAPVP